MKQSAFRAPIAVSIGAIGGALSRYYLTLWFVQQFGTAVYGTFFVNITGCFGMGCFATIARRQGRITLHPELLLLVTTGFLGAYTTFSTYELETAHLSANGWAGLLYGLGSVGLGMASLRTGTVLARSIGTAIDSD